MVWVRIDDAIGEHPKIARLSDSAFALFVMGLAYCNRNLTDGFIPSAVGMGQLRFCDGNTIPPIRELEAAGLWEEVAGGWNIHDFGLYQPSRASVLTERESARQRQAASRQKSRRDIDGSHGPVTAAPVPVPVPKDQERLSDPKPTNYTPEFEAWWQVWPRREAKAIASKAHAKARRKASQAELVAGVHRYVDLLSLQPNRPVCHASTWLNQERWLDEPQIAAVGRDPANDLPRIDHAG